MSVETGNGWIASVPPEHADGTLAEAYQSQFEKIGRVTELARDRQPLPRTWLASGLHLYAVVDGTQSDVPDHVRRAVALLTSVLNGCLFCTAGHTGELTATGYAGLAQAIKADPEGVTTGDAKADAAISYTRKLVTTPQHIVEEDVAALRDAGWSDLDILDINNITAYYCYINRVAAASACTVRRDGRGIGFRFAVSLQNDRPIAETVEHARLAESLGYPEIWTNENGHYRGIFTVASAIVANTATARIGLGIVNPFHRHPSAIAMEAAAALDEASGGRVVPGNRRGAVEPA